MTLDISGHPERLAGEVAESVTGVNVYDEQRNDSRHHVVLPCEGETSYLLLRVPDMEHGVYNLPLGKVPNETREEAERRAVEDAEGESDNILVPVLPLVYTTPEANPDHARFPEGGDRLYVFVDGYLWRELAFSRDALLQDVNLQYVAGRDGPDRPATGAGISRLVLPYRINNHEPEIRVALSKTPWSWARINSLGGMNPDDFRLEDAGQNGWAERIPPAAAQLDGARERLDERTQALDLSDYPAGYTSDTIPAECAAIENPDARKQREAKDTSEGSRVHTRRLRDVTGVVYLHDPIRVAMELAAATENAQAELDQINERAQAKPLFQTAVLARNVFFNADLHAHETERDRAGMLSWRETKIYDDQSQLAERLRECAAGMDEDYIREAILLTSERRRARRRVRQAIARQAAYLDARLLPPDTIHGATQPISEAVPDAVVFSVALRDFAYHEGIRYLHLWNVFADVIRRLNHDPFNTDIDVADADIEAEQDETRPGKPVLDELIPDSNDGQTTPDDGEGIASLASVLFPGADEVDVTDPDDTGDDDDAAKAARGEFRPETFRRAVEEANNQSSANTKLAEALFAVPERLFADLTIAFQQQAQGNAGPYSAGLTAPLIRLYKATAERDAVGLRLIPADWYLDDNILLDGRWNLQDHFRRASQAPAANARGWRNFPPGTASVDLSGEQPLRAVTEAQFQEIFTKQVPYDPKPRTIRPYVAVANGSSAAKDIAAAMQHGTDQAAKKITPILTVWAALNLHGTIEKWNKAEGFLDETRGAAKFVIAAGALSTTIADAIKALVPEQSLSAMGKKLKGYGKAGNAMVRVGSAHIPVIRIGRVPLIPFLNGAFAFGGAMFATWDAVTAASRGNQALMLGYGIQAVSAGALTVLTWAGGASAAGTGLTGGAAGTLLGLGVWGWVALAGVLITTVIIEMLKDTPIEAWCHHGPFGQEGQRYKDPHDDLEPAKDTDDGERAAKAVKAHQRLLDILMQPDITLRRHKDEEKDARGDEFILEADCHIPGLDPHDSALDLIVDHKVSGYEFVRVPVEGGGWKRTTKPLEPGDTPRSSRDPETSLLAVPVRLVPKRYKPIHNDQTGSIVRLRILYHTEKVLEIEGDQYFAYLNHTTAEGFEIPSPRGDAKEAENRRDRQYVTDKLVL